MGGWASTFIEAGESKMVLWSNSVEKPWVEPSQTGVDAEGYSGDFTITILIIDLHGFQNIPHWFLFWQNGLPAPGFHEYNLSWLH